MTAAPTTLALSQSQQQVVVRQTVPPVQPLDAGRGEVYRG